MIASSAGDPPAPSQGRADGRGFGVVAADLNGDGKIDMFVANDMSPNFVFLNKGDGTFEDATETSGAGYDVKGEPQSGMGADAEDIDGDGLPELTITNFGRDVQHPLSQPRRGAVRRLDRRSRAGQGLDALGRLGLGLVDFDNDGWPDEFVANGHVDDNARLLGQADRRRAAPASLRQPRGQTVPARHA